MDYSAVPRVCLPHGLEVHRRQEKAGAAEVLGPVPLCTRAQLSEKHGRHGRGRGHRSGCGSSRGRVDPGRMVILWQRDAQSRWCMWSDVMCLCVLWPRNMQAGYCFTSVCFWYSGQEEWPKIRVNELDWTAIWFGKVEPCFSFSVWWNLPCSCVAKTVCDILKFEVKNYMEISFASIIKRCVSAVERRLSLHSESLGLTEQSSSDGTALWVCAFWSVDFR